MPDGWADEWWSHRLTPAGFIPRAAAFLFDVVFSIALAVSYYWFFRGFAELTKRQRVELWNNPHLRAAFFEVRYELVGLVGLIYLLTSLFFEASPLGGSLGKRLFGIRVTDEFGERLSFTAAIVRNLTKLVSIVAAGAGCLMIFWTRGRRALHDWAARSFVAKG